MSSNVGIVISNEKSVIKKSAPIDNAIALLYKDIDALEDNLNTLTEKVNPIMQSQPVEVESNSINKEPHFCLSFLGSEICTAQERIKYLNSIVLNILDRLEI